MEYFHIVLVFVFCCSLLAQVDSIKTYNVDVQEPFIIRSPATADRTDGFGWSTVFHQFQEANPSDTFAQALAKVRVLVGAPRGSASGGLVNRTGVVYSCTVSSTGTCEGIEGDTSVYIMNGNNLANNPGSVTLRQLLYPREYSEGRLYDKAENSRFTLTSEGFPVAESKSGQLIGSQLFSSGTRFLACGSQWRFVFENQSPSITAFSRYRPWGICLVGNRQLENILTASPCLEGGTTIANEGTCTAGISALIANDRVYVGAPTTRDYEGDVFSIPLNNVGGGAGDDFFEGRPDAYYGFEIASGSLTGSATQDIVTSGTRYQQNDISPRVGGIFSLAEPITPLAMGQQLAESFGYSVALVDLNGDGFAELVAGAPMYSIFEGQLRVECGRVFIYYNDAGTLNTTNPYVFFGSAAFMRLGMKVINGGDLNSDGISDLIVSAPYERSNMTNSTGAIYVYHGFKDRTEFESQIPQRIHADTIVSTVDNLDTLTTFGFSVSAQFDADSNSHTDIVVGGYESQIVTVLRTRPFANVQIEFAAIPDVNLNTDSSFSVNITANYSSEDRSLSSSRMFGFELREQRNAINPARLFFTDGTPTHTVYSGMLNFNPQQIATQAVTVYIDRDGDPTIPYQLTFSLVDVEKSTPDTTGRTIQPLNMFPRFRLLGNPDITVNISDLCNGDGCQSDVIVRPVQDNIPIVAGETRSAEFIINYSNAGPEEARGLQLVITNIPTSILNTSIIVSTTVTGGSSEGLMCVTNLVGDGTRKATCDLVDRFVSGDVRNLTINMPVSIFEITGELVFGIKISIQTDMTGNNSEASLANNMANVNISVESISDISVSTSFPQSRLEYSAQSPLPVTSSTDLGLSGRLSVRVSNAGPSTIQNARVTIYFPARSSITGDYFFLYPASLTSPGRSGGTTVVCNQMNVDPEGLGMDVSRNRRKRSEQNRARRSVSKARVARQAVTPNLNCGLSPMACTVFVCVMSKLATEVDIVLDFTVDERFFSSQESNSEYNLTALAVVEVLDAFQRDGDNRDNDRSSDWVLLVPPTADAGQGPLFYVAIILPIVIGVIILVIVGFLLYYFGFFRRKKREDEEELEPVPEQNGPPGQAPAAPSKSEDTKEEEITKV